MEKLNVLIVEDDPLLRSGLAVIVDAEEDMRVCGLAGNGLEALERLERTAPDIVLLDLQMPEMDGLTCIREIRGRRADLPILILTTFNEEEYIFRGLAAGANGYVIKGLDFERLTREIRDAARGRFVMPAEVAAKVASFAMADDSYLKQRGLQRFLERSGAFTAKEREIVALLFRRYSNKEIAERLFLSEGTIKNNLTVIYGKLGVGSWQEAIHRLEALAAEERPL